jgi:hypothetical protein
MKTNSINFKLPKKINAVLNCYSDCNINVSYIKKSIYEITISFSAGVFSNEYATYKLQVSSKRYNENQHLLIMGLLKQQVLSNLDIIQEKYTQQRVALLS